MRFRHTIHVHVDNSQGCRGDFGNVSIAQEQASNLLIRGKALKLSAKLKMIVSVKQR